MTVLQTLELELERAAVHPADDFGCGARRILDGDMRADDRRPHESLHGFRLGGGELWIDDQCAAVSLAAVIGKAQHCEVIGRHASIPEVDGGQDRRSR